MAVFSDQAHTERAFERSVSRELSRLSREADLTTTTVQLRHPTVFNLKTEPTDRLDAVLTFEDRAPLVASLAYHRGRHAPCSLTWSTTTSWRPGATVRIPPGVFRKLDGTPADLASLRHRQAARLLKRNVCHTYDGTLSLIDAQAIIAPHPAGAQVTVIRLPRKGLVRRLSFGVADFLRLLERLDRPER